MKSEVAVVVVVVVVRGCEKVEWNGTMAGGGLVGGDLGGGRVVF